MFISEPATFHDSIKPLVYFNCFAGNGALRQPNQSDVIYFFIRLYTALVALLNWTTIYISLSLMKPYLEIKNVSSMSVMMQYVMLYTNAFITITTPLLVWLQRRGLRDCLREMPVLDDTLRAALGVQTEYKKQYIRLNCQIIGIILVMFVVAIWDFVTILGFDLSKSIESVLLACCFSRTIHYPILLLLLLDLNFCAFVGYLGKKFEDLNASLLGLAEKPLTSCRSERPFLIPKNGTKITPVNEAEVIGAESSVNDKHHLLREIRKGHLELCKLSQRINLTFGIQNLVTLGISFVMITGSLYTVYSAFSWENFTDSKLKEVISTAVWTSIYVFKIWIVNHSCWSVRNEAGRTGTVIYELLNSRVDKELERKINEFGVQLLQHPVTFNACGFFTLDYTFVQGVIGSITTYLVILIQMSPASKSLDAYNPALAGNSTEISPNQRIYL